MKTVFRPRKRTKTKEPSYVLRVGEEVYKVLSFIAECTGQSITKVATALLENALLEAEIDTRIEDDLLSAYKAKHTTESADTGCGK